MQAQVYAQAHVHAHAQAHKQKLNAHNNTLKTTPHTHNEHTQGRARAHHQHKQLFLLLARSLHMSENVRKTSNSFSEAIWGLIAARGTSHESTLLVNNAHARLGENEQESVQRASNEDYKNKQTTN